MPKTLKITPLEFRIIDGHYDEVSLTPLKITPLEFRMYPW